MFQVNKPKSAAKIMIPPSNQLSEKVLTTLQHAALMVGATLGPGGRQVLIERQEIGMKPIVTKDGVTVMKNLGYEDGVRQLILESARDAATRTASEAGDGTTTATILSSSIAEYTYKAVAANPKLSPQKIVRELMALMPVIEAMIRNRYTISIEGHDQLLKVASLSANGDDELAAAVLEAFNVVGDEGNLSIVEMTGTSKYEVARIHGFSVETGHEESCRTMANGFLNDKSGTKVVMEAPVILLYDGVINDISQVFETLGKLGDYFASSGRPSQGAVLVAHGFSDSVLGDFHVNWNHPKSTVKVFPLLAPKNALRSSATNFLYDLQAYTGSPVFNPIDKPLVDLDPESLCRNCRVTFFEADRYKSTILASEDMTAIELRVDELKEQLKRPESQYEENDLRVRIGKLTSGIARLHIYGPSQGETREKRDRAEDAWMAVRGAVNHGACPGGGYVLVKVAADLTVTAQQTADETKKLAMLILGEALLRPVEILYQNYGYNKQEIDDRIIELLSSENKAFDISRQIWVDKAELLDSAPAVVEAIRNSISIASLLGSLGGIVAFNRDGESDKAEEKFVRQFESATGQRGSVENG